MRRHADEYGGVAPATVRQTIDRVSRAWWSDPERHRQGRLDLRATRARTVGAALAELGLIADGLALRLADTFAHLRTEGLRLFPGARQTLAHFRAADVPLALVTNGDSAGQRHKIERFGLAPYFDEIVIEEELGVGKPDERVFRHALQALGAETQHTWMVGDNRRWEIEPARRLGLHAVWVDVRGEAYPPISSCRPIAPCAPSAS